MTPAVKWIIWANIALFVVSLVCPRAIIAYLGLIPQAVLERGWIWQPVTYMFLHAGPMHILFNMLGVWMFGVELERLWGTQFFVRYYAITGVGAGITAIAGRRCCRSRATARHLRRRHDRRVRRALRPAAGLRDVLPDRPILMFLCSRFRRNTSS